MKKKPIVPLYPKTVVIDQEVQKNFDGWLSYIKNLSPRIKVLLPSDKEFVLETFERCAKIAALRDDDTEENIEKSILHGWPEFSSVAFLVTLDSSLPGHRKVFAVENTFLFCFGDIAFGLDYFHIISWEEEEDEWEYADHEYSLEDYPESALSWEYIAKRIKDRLIELEKMAPIPPVNT